MTKPVPATQIVLVDDHPVVITGVSAILDAEPDLSVVGVAKTAADAMSLFAQTRPELAILDISLEDEKGLCWIAKLMSRYPNVRIILHSMHSDQEIFRNSLQMQVAGYVLKTSDPRSIVYAVRSVRSGGTYVDPVLMSDALARGLGSSAASSKETDKPAISTREMETLRLTALGYGIKEIASEFHLSPKSIETYKLRAVEKLGLKSRSSIVRYAIASGWFASL